MKLQDQADFEQALGEAFADAVCPPVPFEDASAHDCVEAVQSVLPGRLDPERFAAIGTAEIEALMQAFADWFECDAPSEAQIRNAIASLLVRWPQG
jgi:hypothetical protein